MTQMSYTWRAQEPHKSEGHGSVVWDARGELGRNISRFGMASAAMTSDAEIADLWRGHL